jgi:hypothetical protein
MRKLTMLLFSLLVVSIVRGQVVDQTLRRSRPLCGDDALLTQRGLRAIRKSINDLTVVVEKANTPQDSYSLCVLAELLKRVGDSRAERYYKAAIKEAPADAEYELLLADYLRNFRGPQRPLFARAELHYFEALRKLDELAEKSPDNTRDEQLRKRIERGLITLYQEDGVPLVDEPVNTEWPETIEKPVIFFGSINRGARSIGDLERVDEVRSFVSEALFAGSRFRLNRPLSPQELAALIRPKRQFETFNRFRFRRGSWPVVDVFSRERRISDAQLTNFFLLGEFNDLKLSDFGIAVEKPFAVSHYFDAYLRASYTRSKRTGLIEFLPDTAEKINELQVNAAASRFVGPDKLVFETTYAYQDINPQTTNPPTRNRQIIGGTFTYQLFRPIPFLDPVYAERFMPRGLHLYSGAVFDRERFGNVAIKKTDFFAGASLKGLGRVDLTLQPTFFKGRVTGDNTQSNSQYRTNFNLLYRLLDEETEPGIPKKKFGVHWAFVHLVFPFKHDVALTGHKEFENFNLGVQTDTKFFTAGHGRTTFLASFRYSYQRFYRLNNNQNLFSFELGMGF